MAKNITNLAQQYKIESDLAITYKRQRNINEYYKHYEKSVKVKGFIDDYINQMNEKQIEINSITYTKLVNHSRITQILTVVIVIDLIILSMLLIYTLTAKMVRPFNKLYKSAEDIAKGDFTTVDIQINAENEFKLLAEAFNKMKNSIANHIEEIKYNAEVENKLKDEQMKNLKMAYLLDNAKLSALQSQINPHFLFNTINAGVQLSVIERAPKTGEFLDTMSRLFRYNIQRINSDCTLKDEINNIKDYYELLKVRFGSRIRFEFKVSEETACLHMPSMILQPIVENSYIHGLSCLESGGCISVEATKEEEFVVIKVSDDGVGLEQETIDMYLNVDHARGQKDHMISEDLKDGSTSEGGIGIRNVKERLELYYHRSDIFFMKGSDGEGVTTIIQVPIKYLGQEEEVTNV